MTTTIMYDFLPELILRIFYLTFLIIGSYIVFISILGLLNRSLLPNIYADSLRRLIPQCSLSIILTSSYKGWCFPFSFHTWSAIPNFSISPRTTAFRCSSSLTGQHISPLYTLPQLQGMEFTEFLVMLNSLSGLTWKRYLWRVEPLVNIVLMSYGLHIFRVFRLVLWHRTDVL